MSAKKFIAELERRRLLSDRLMARLRDSLAGSERPLSAEALAKFLVQKNRLSEQQAREVLGGLSQSGVNLVEEDAADAGNSPEDSSIFPDHLNANRKKTPEQFASSTTADDDEIRLVPIDEDLIPAKKPSAVEEDLPVLGVRPTQEPRSKRPAKPPAELLPELGTSTEPINLIDAEPGSGAEPMIEAVPTARRTTRLSRGGKRKAKKKGKPAKDRKRWDSPLILVGGGVLTFLLLVGGTIWWLLGRETGDQKLAQADAALKSGAYAQAIDQYEEFLKNYPRHAEHSLARVQLAMVRIRQPTEAKDFAAALTAAETELKSVEDEESFNDAHGDLAALLPQIALGLANAAEKANPTSEDAKKFAGLANQALELCNNVAYIPKSLRDEGKLANVKDTLDRVARQQQTQLALAAGLKAIAQAGADSKPIVAYTVHMKLLKDHPELAGDATLTAAIQKTTSEEQAGIHFVKEAKAAETTERPTPWRAALAIANRRIKPAAPPAGVSGTACIQVGGAVYGLDAASGRLLWRRHVGFGATATPILIERDVIVANATRNELLRLNAATGHLIWRQTIGEPFANLLVAGDRALVPTKSGRLYAVDLKSGGRTGYLQFAQPLPVAPTLDRQKTRIYLPGEQATLYSVSLADFKCIGVKYLGHAPDSIRVPIAAVMDKVAVIENDGVETSHLHLISLDDKGAIGKQVADRRLNGLAASPPIVTGRGMIVVTDRGQIEAYDVASGSGANPLTLVATRDATSSQPLVRYIAVTGRNVWVADTQLTKYSIVPTGNRLPVEEIENNFAGATFNHPLTVFGDALIHVRRPKDRAGFVVTASDTKQGHPLWETDLAMPPAGPPVVDEAAKSLAVASAEGYVFRFDEAAIRSRIQDEPLAAERMPPELPALAAAVDLGQGRAVFCAPDRTG